MSVLSHVDRILALLARGQYWRHFERAGCTRGSQCPHLIDVLPDGMVVCRIKTCSRR